MNIMYATDDGYVEIMAVSIKSLLETNNPKDIKLFIVIDEVSEDNLNKLEKMIHAAGATVQFINKPNIREMLNVQLKTLRWSDSAYSRLFLKLLYGERFPEVSKLLYIDCDTIVVGDLKELWNTDISDYLGAACLECMSNMHKRILGAKSSDNYINTGMILFNVSAWKEENIDNMMIDYIRKYKGKTEYVDQGVINGTISNRMLLVDPRYNLTCLAYDFSYEEMQLYRKPSFGYCKDEWENAIKNPAIIHFTTSFLNIRPWFKGSKHPYAGVWKEIHDKTPWNESEYRILVKRKKRDRVEKIYKLFPSFIAVRVAGFLHSYIKPIMFTIR